MSENKRKLGNKHYLMMLALGVCCILGISAMVFVHSARQVYATDGVSREEWIHTLVETFDMTVEDGIMPDDYYGDITESEYYEDILIAMNFGVIELEAGEDFKPDELVTREFAAQTMNYCLGFKLEDTEAYTMSDVDALLYPDDDQIAIKRGWFELVDGKFMPEATITMAEKEGMIADAITVWSSTEIDEDHENTYKFVDGIIEIPEITEASIGEDGIITIYDTSVEINENDTFAMIVNGIPHTYVAAGVTKEDDGLVIETQETDYREVMEEVDAEGLIEVDLSQVEALSDDVTIRIVEEEDVVPVAASAPVPVGAAYDSKKIQSITLDKKVKLGDGGYAYLSVEITDLYVDYKLKYNDYYFGVHGNATVEGTIGAETSANIPLAVIPVDGVGSITVSVSYTVSGKAMVQFTTGLETGVQYTKNDGFRFVKNFHHSNLTLYAEVKATTKCRLALDIDIPFVASGVIYAEVGIKDEVNLTVHGDGKSPSRCTNISAYLFATVGSSINLPLVDKTYNKTYNIYTMDNSPYRVYYHIEDGTVVMSCARGAASDTPKYLTSYSTGSSSSGTGRLSSQTSSCLVWDTTTTLYEYELDDENHATITKYNGSASYVSIPEEIDGYIVTVIGEEAFRENAGICSVIIPDTVTTIEKHAFYKCESLKTVQIPDSVTTIGNSAFAYCTNLTNVDLPEKLVEVGFYAFRDCDKIAKITIPKSLETVRSLNGGPFYDCSGLKEVNFEEGITQIPANLFYVCDGIEEIVIPDSVTIIGDSAFRECENLSEVQFSDNVILIDNQAFQGCVSLETIQIPDSVTSIEDSAFRECTNLKTVEIPDSVTAIGNYTFAYCSSLSDIDLPGKLVELGHRAFEDCDLITKITIPKSLETVNSFNGGPFYDCSGLKEVVFEEGGSQIQANLFYGCDGIEKIVIPDGVTAIGERAFRDCVNLKAVQMPEGILSIGPEVFSGCISLTELSFPDTVTYMGKQVCEDSTSLETVHLSEAMTSLPDNAFEGCTSLESIVFPEGMTSIGKSAFYECTSLQSVVLPDSLNTLKDYAFAYCDLLSDVELGAGITEIPKYAFYEDSALENVILPQQVTTVKDYAFANCWKLTDITINRNVTSIQADAFSYPAKMTIYGVKDTYAEEFALANEINFVELNVAATDMRLNYSELQLGKGETLQLTAEITPMDSSDELTWTSTDESVVTVSETGLVKAIGIGEASVVATAGSIVRSCEITVYQSVSSVSLNSAEETLELNATLQLEVTISPSNATNQNISWSTSDSTVATVSENGLVTAVGYGDAVITVTTEDGGCTDTCTIHVTTETQEYVNPFTDVADNAWYAKSVQYAVQNGLFTGTSATTFTPNGEMTRGMLVTVLYRAAGRPTVTGGRSYEDVKSSAYYAKAVQWASSIGLATGYSDGKFHPNDPVTREQVAKMLYQYAKYSGKDVTAKTDITGYKDYAKISGYAVKYMEWTAAEGIITGSSNKLNPKGNATRAEIASMLRRYMQK